MALAMGLCGKKECGLKGREKSSPLFARVLPPAPASRDKIPNPTHYGGRPAPGPQIVALSSTIEQCRYFFQNAILRFQPGSVTG